jgi:hypothetical protein
MKPEHVILGVHVTDRLKAVAEVQKVFTQYGSLVKTRLGLHEIGNSPEGLVVLELVGEKKARKDLEEKLGAIEGIEVKKMVFSHKA